MIGVERFFNYWENVFSIDRNGAFSALFHNLYFFGMCSKAGAS